LSFDSNVSSMPEYDIEKLDDYRWQIPKQGGMRVPAILYATEPMLRDILSDNAPQQAANVAHMPGIVKASLAMPDIHWGYGFPIGGVAAFDAEDGVISPGGVGYDINCGVRLMSSKLTKDDINKNSIERLVDALFARVPTGVGSSGAMRVDRPTLRRVLQTGAPWAVREGYGSDADLDVIEEGGQVDGADPDAVSDRALERGLGQIGTLGSGNHFLEVGYVSEVIDERAARVMGLDEGTITVIIHSGSRGFGYQVCDDALSDMDRAMNRYDIDLPDRQLACTPITSPEGQKYIRGMRCAINYAFANRQVMSHNTRLAFEEALDVAPREHGLFTVYEVAHNIAKFETHRIDGREQEVCVHRKGATRALPAGHPLVPGRYQKVGQPVLIPGDMGRYSYVLVGTERAMDDTFGSTCHGAGRQMSRRQARKTAGNRNITAELANEGIVVRGESRRTVREEISEAYKDVADVVHAVEGAGISTAVAQLRPLGVIKG